MKAKLKIQQRVDHYIKNTISPKTHKNICLEVSNLTFSLTKATITDSLKKSYTKTNFNQKEFVDSLVKILALLAHMTYGTFGPSMGKTFNNGHISF